jgi:hypothetical protein
MKRHIESEIIALGGLLLFSAVVLAQQRATPLSAATPVYLRPDLFDDSFSAQVAALGPRVQRPGLERMVLAGILNNRGSQSSVTAVWEVPNRFRLEHVGSGRKAVGFDGDAAWSSEGQVGEDDLAAIESMAADSAEGF